MNNRSRLCLVILDGWGIGNHDFSNPIYQASPAYFKILQEHFPYLSLQASGLSVGLPYGMPGNSEVGHLTMGSGQILYQDYVRISRSIDDKTFFTNPALLKTYNHALTNNSTLHLLGLLSSSYAHSSFNHIIALLDLAKSLSVKKVKLHLLLDGQDASPFDGLELLTRLEKEMKQRQVGEIASISGRFYGMDINNHSERLSRYYQTIFTGKSISVSDWKTYLQKSYQKNITDEYIAPILVAKDNISKNLNTIHNNDAVVIFNYRANSIIDLAKLFTIHPSVSFPVHPLTNLAVTTMTQYDKRLPFLVAFPPQKITTSLAKVLSQNSKRQLHLAEAERASHITYFFDGLRQRPYPGEYWVILPASSSLRPENNPQLNASAITTRLAQAFEENIYDFVAVNYANPDIIGHTSNIQAGIHCAKFIDQEMRKVATLAQKYNYSLIITSDHGNLERMMNPKTGEIETGSDPSLVPFYFLSNSYYYKQPRSLGDIHQIETTATGMLTDIAPTVLDLLNLPIPPEMIGQSLVPLF